MSQGDGAIYYTFKELVMEGVYDLSSGNDAIQTILVGDYVPDLATHTQYGHVSGSEYNTGLGYTSFGETLASQDVTLNDSTGMFDGADETWTSLGPLTPTHPSYAIMFDDTATDDPLIAYWEVSGTAPNGANWTLEWGVNGIILLS